MKRTIYLLVWVFAIAIIPQTVHAAMDSYCSAPPYVTRSIMPNVMINLDNSCDMLNPAYEHPNPSTSLCSDGTTSCAYSNSNTYTGYFISNAYYYQGNTIPGLGAASNSPNQFGVVCQTVTSSDPYLVVGSGGTICGGAVTLPVGYIVFKGNWLNYMTMSRFDLLQKILTGGNAAVARGAGGVTSGIKSVSGSSCGGTEYQWEWTDSAYPGCKFEIEGGKFEIEKQSSGTPCKTAGGTTILAAAPQDNSTFFARAMKGLHLGKMYDKIAVLAGKWGLWPNPHNDNEKRSFNLAAKPASHDSSEKTLFAKAMGQLTDAAKSVEGINIVPAAHAAASVSIDTSSPLTAGTVSQSYSTTLAASGGSAPYTWSLPGGSCSSLSGTSGLPPGLSLSSGGVISGTPTTAGTYKFEVKAQESGGGNKKKCFNLTINAAASTSVTITSTSFTGTVSSSFSQNLTAQFTIGGTTYTCGYGVTTTTPASSYICTWSLGSGTQSAPYLPFGLFLDSATGTISGNTCPFTSTGATTGVAGNSGGTCLKTDTFSVVSGKGYQVSSCSTGGDGGSYTGDPYLNLSGVYSGSNNDSCSLGSKLTFTAGSSGTETVCQSTYNTHTVGTGASPADTTWSYNIKNTTDGVSCQDTFKPNIVVTVSGGGVTAFSTNKDVTITIGAASAGGTNELEYKIWVQASGTDFLGTSLPSDTGTGLIQQFWGKANFGLTNFDQVGSSVRIKLNECIGSSGLSQFLNSVDSTVPSNVTTAPLADSYYAIIKYFQNIKTSGTTTYWWGGCGDPYASDSVKCRKNFVLTLSSAYDLSNSLFGTNFTQATGCTATNSGSTSKPLIQNTCYAYQNDLRSDKSGTQNLYHYAVFTFANDTETVSSSSGNGTNRGANKKILQDSALTAGGKFYDASQGSQVQTQITNAFTDILGTAASGTAVSVLTTSSRGVGSMVQAYFLPTTLQGTRDVLWTGYTQNIWIDPKDKLREDTTNDYQLKLDSTVSDGDKVIKLYFDTAANETKVATFTTDGNGENGTLASCSAPDSAIKKFSDVKYLWEAGKKLALRRPDTNGSVSARNLFTATKVRRGSSEIYDFTGDNVFTSSNITNDTSNCSGLSGDRLTLCNALDRDTDTAAYDDSASNIVRYVRGECLETGVNGNTVCGATAGSTYRDRRITVYEADGTTLKGDTNGNVWKLGDIISSTPKVFANTPLNTYHIDYGDSTYYNYVTSNSYKQKSSLAFVGANDGVLHAFRVGYLKDTGLAADINALFQNFYSGDTGTDKLGEEVWGYIPFNAFPYLKYLANTGYCHIYYNDLSVRLVDASIGGNSALNGSEGGTLPTDTKSADGSSWKTVLIGGMRFGGGCSGAGASPAPPATVSNVGYSAYYAIDITDPENPVPLWEFSDADMGYATTFPSVIRTGDTNKNGYWYAAIGSGSKTMPKSNTDINRDSTDTGYVYILNLKTGELVKKITLDHAAIVGDILAIDADKNYSAEKIYFGTSYLDTTWKGKLVGIEIPNQDLSAAWTPAIKYLFADSYPFTASPDATRDADGNIWVYAGSGKYYSDIDDSDTSTQLFLGIKDKDSGITYPKAASGLTDRTSTATTYNTITGTTKVCMYDSATPAGFKLTDVVTSTDATSTVTVPTVGWYISLTANGTGERVITRPLAVGGLVDFLTYKPDVSDPCSYGGNSYLYAVGYTTGVAPTNIAIMSPDIVTGGTIKKGVLLGPGAPPTGEAIIVPPPKEGQEVLKKKIQIATGVIVEAENQPVTSVISKVVHWLKK